MDAINRNVTVDTLRSDHVELIQRVMPSTERFVDGARTNSHAQRFAAQQSGAADYVVAWIDRQPVGHALVRWNGALDAHFSERGVRDPYVEGLAVRADCRSMGVGMAIMREAEHRASTRGYRRIGLAVGIHNERARRLYDRLGYCESRLGQFEVTWTYIDGAGKEQVEGETCTYLVKDLQ